MFIELILKQKIKRNGYIMSDNQITGRINRIWAQPRQIAQVICLIVCSVLACLILSFTSLWLYGSVYFGVAQVGWKEIELPVGTRIRVPNEWMMDIDSNGTNITLTDRTGDIVFYGFHCKEYDDASIKESLSQLFYTVFSFACIAALVYLVGDIFILLIGWLSLTVLIACLLFIPMVFILAKKAKGKQYLSFGLSCHFAIIQSLLLLVSGLFYLAYALL